MNESLVSKVALVTGASRGIGKAISLELAKNGAKLALIYRSSNDEAVQLQKDITDFGGESIIIKANLSDENDVNRMVSGIIEKWGKIDIVVNCAGIMKDNYIENISLEEWNDVINTNLQGVFLTCKAVIPHLKKNGGGSIINISSQAAYRGSIKHAHYSAAKSGLLGLTFTLAKELGPYNITANIVSPGRIATDMIHERISERGKKKWMEETPLGRFGTPEEVAFLVNFLASPMSRYITGANININGGLLMG